MEDCGSVKKTTDSTITHHETDDKEMNTKGSDTEDDYFSVKGEFSRSCSNASSPLEEEESDSKEDIYPLEEKKDLSEFFQDSIYESNQTDHTRILFQFLKDECWNEEIDKNFTPSRPEEERFKSKEHLSSKKLGSSSMVKTASQYHRRTSVKHGNADKAENCCCFPRRNSSKEKQTD